MSLARWKDEYLFYGFPDFCQKFQVRDRGKQAQGCQGQAGEERERPSFETGTGLVVR